MRERDRTADEDKEQIELFVIAAYPNTRMPAIILPTLGMAGGKWDSSLCSVILLDFFTPPFSCYSLFWRIENNFPACIHRGHGSEGKKLGRRWLRARWERKKGRR